MMIDWICMRALTRPDMSTGLWPTTFLWSRQPGKRNLNFCRFRELGLTSWLPAFLTYALASYSRPQNIKYASQAPPPLQRCRINTPMRAYLQISLFLPPLLLCSEASPLPASFVAYITAVKCKREWLCPLLAQALCNNSLDLFSSRWPLLISVMTLKMFLKGQTRKLEQKKPLSQLLH